MHAVVAERPDLAGRKAQSRFAEARNRYGTAEVDAVRLGELVRGAMVAVEKPWWTT